MTEISSNFSAKDTIYKILQEHDVQYAINKCRCSYEDDIMPQYYRVNVCCSIM